MSGVKLTPSEYRKMRTRKRRIAENRYKLRLKQLSEHSCRGMYSTAYSEESENGKSYYKRLYRSKYSWGYRANYKKISNRRVRRYNGEIADGGSYRRIFDYWWTII